ncbi:DUF2415 domain-containing protein [Fusarium falciforme]|uniref:DUF2415 domain-containing protein n=1 Tax=Fusarium falciforme TaxID=195108 RepID=A0A9W8RAB0_9HYPO|nr:DUF2415 domain-containing protein [Fusarium falciforme]KAJ4189704.1 hypothetical protein NW755_005707 [Fusarium falciforme]KAJ4210061.1 hypothetical protein NW767_000338 [Fusarium falciforme]KAJ4256460.1 hypothetical protein NW757_004090 [Fusarium falciforme]WAO85234.1 DUF2415 domain-containing protein [Fusarium falciforme]
MAVDESEIYPTEALVSKQSRKHYRIPVRPQHWQLRSLVSAEKKNIVYFPGGNGSNHVQRLNTTTRECETIKLLTFAPRCLVAEKGWLCCGSENGDFVAMRLDDGNDDDNQGSSLDLDPETRLSLGLDSTREGSLFSLISRARRSNKSLIAKSMKLAKDRVNCVTLWFPPTILAAHERAYTEPVAILANNDRTVILVSLRDFDQKEKIEPLDVITYPDFVNRALISPDGRLLIAILDDPYLYVHQRVRKPSESSSRSRESTGYQWEQTQRILLKSQRKDDKTDSRGSFAACFSESGAYLAVGTQHGTISIFNAALLSNPDADPLITSFQSSRPHSGPGAVRDMAFCPGPYGILAWTEDRGHVGIADMRSNFTVRQIVDIEEPGFEHINILDRNTIDPRLLENRRDRRDNTTSPGGNESSRRRLEMLDTLNSPLTANETLVLEAMQLGRRNRERQRATGTDDRPTAATSTLWAERSTRRPTNDDSGRPEERRSSSIGRAMGDLLGTYRAGDRLRGARPIARDTSDTPENGRRSDQRWMESLGETVAMLREQRQRQDSSYLTVLEILQARERGGDRDQDDTSIIVPLVNQVVTRWEDDHGGLGMPPSPDNTAGLAWSEDGRTLFVGAQNGIYELHVDVQSRKFCPSVSMR